MGPGGRPAPCCPSRYREVVTQFSDRFERITVTVSVLRSIKLQLNLASFMFPAKPAKLAKPVKPVKPLTSVLGTERPLLTNVSTSEYSRLRSVSTGNYCL